LSGLSSENWPFDSNLRFRLQRPDLGIGGHRRIGDRLDFRRVPSGQTQAAAGCGDCGFADVEDGGDFGGGLVVYQRQ